LPIHLAFTHKKHRVEEREFLKTAESGYPNIDTAVTWWTSAKSFGGISIKPVALTSLLRMTVGSRGRRCPA
jgi:hypothetical protein